MLSVTDKLSILVKKSFFFSLKSERKLSLHSRFLMKTQNDQFVVFLHLLYQVTWSSADHGRAGVKGDLKNVLTKQ